MNLPEPFSGDSEGTDPLLSIAMEHPSNGFLPSASSASVTPSDYTSLFISPIPTNSSGAVYSSESALFIRFDVCSTCSVKP